MDAEEGTRVPERERDSREDFQAVLRAQAAVVEPRTERPPGGRGKRDGEGSGCIGGGGRNGAPSSSGELLDRDRQIRVNRSDRAGDIYRMAEDHDCRARERDVVRGVCGTGDRRYGERAKSADKEESPHEREHKHQTGR
jgi:hypothetical protein